ncbi:MAG: type II secretion system minor pseudopilin GspJ [Desulfoarculaceae bacterium]|nr:type II secretion system minor pseudopilin GspJ [Desulfoarculaceae bacterium]
MIVRKPITDTGFTLLEILVAMAIFAVISVMTFHGLQAILKTREDMDLEGDRLASLQRVMIMMSRDFEQIVARRIRDEYGGQQPALLCQALAEKTVEFSRGGWRNPATLARSSIQRVSYRFIDRSIVRESWPVLDRAVATKPLSQTVLTGVDDFRLRFLDRDEEWQTSWPPEAREASNDQRMLPQAIEVTLDLEDWGTIHRLFLLAWEGGE